MEALEKEIQRLNKVAPKAANNIKKIGPSAQSAAKGVKAFGASLKAALGPLAPILAGIGGLSAAFSTLKAQDFSEAKFASLGGNSQQLVTNLKDLSNELQGQASVAELTGAAYDVASAGFASAAEATLVLKAASQGATGGFSDINTVANATTSVLNAYGMSAANAGKLVDQFIQTQNDGKIVVAEYAANIGKVASAAAGLGVPLSEVNAVIAQSTASGVQAEVAFTGLKGALARLASGEASKALKDVGIEINASTVEADGLLGTLQKLQGLDTGQIFKALGTEAGPALLPVIQNLERYEELILNQKEAQGTAAAAAATAAGTIEGAWKRVTVAFQNLFSDQSELGQIIRATLLAAAATVEALGAAFKILLAPIRAVIEFIGEVGSALFGLDSAETVLQQLTQAWFDQIKAVQNTADTIIAVGKVAGQYVGQLVSTVAGWFSSLWNGISQGVQSVVGAITGAFSTAFNNAKNIIVGFYNSLPNWLKGALNAAGSVVGGVTSAVAGAIKNVVDDIQAAKAQVQIDVPDASKVALPQIKTPSPLTGGGSSGGGGGGGSKGASRESQVPALQRELTLARELEQLYGRIAEAELAGDQETVIRLRNEEELFKLKKEEADILAENIPEIEKQLKLELLGFDVRKQVLDTSYELKELEQARAEALEGVIRPIEDEIELLQAKINGNEEQIKQLQEIERLSIRIAKAQDRNDPNAADTAKATSLVTQRDELKAQAKQVQETEEMWKSLANTIESEIGSAMSSAIIGLIDGTKTAEEAFSNMFKNIGKAFVDMATQMIAKALVMKALGILQNAFGGAPAGGGGGSFFPLGQGFSFEGGGYTGDGPRSGGLDGRGGYMAMVHPQETIVDHHSAMGRYSGAGSSGGGGSRTIRFESTMINNVEYVTTEQAMAMSRQAADDGAKRGAAGGHARSMSTLKNSRSQRSKIGMR